MEKKFKNNKILSANNRTYTKELPKVDWTTDIADARRRVGNKVALQGNMDPSMLYAPPARIEEEVATILAGFGHGEGHVFNLGHGIHQDVLPEHAGVFVEAVHRLSEQYHR